MPLIALARLVQGLAAGPVWTAALAAISDVYPQELGFRMGLAETGGGVMGLVGPPFAGVLIEMVGLDATFFIATALPALALIPALLVPETRREGAAAPMRLLQDLRRLWSVPAARVAAVTLATAAAVLALVEPLLPLDLADRLDLSSLGVGGGSKDTWVLSS